MFMGLLESPWRSADHCGDLILPFRKAKRQISEAFENKKALSRGERAFRFSQNLIYAKLARFLLLRLKSR